MKRWLGGFVAVLMLAVSGIVAAAASGSALGEQGARLLLMRAGFARVRIGARKLVAIAVRAGAAKALRAAEVHRVS